MSAVIGGLGQCFSMENAPCKVFSIVTIECMCVCCVRVYVVCVCVLCACMLCMCCACMCVCVCMPVQNHVQINASLFI